MSKDGEETGKLKMLVLFLNVACSRHLLLFIVVLRVHGQSQTVFFVFLFFLNNKL